MPDPVRVFVSHHHSKEEDAFTARLVADLKAASADVWVDNDQIKSDDFVRKISEGLEGRQWLILVMTPASVQSPWVQREVNAALNEVTAGRMLGVLPLVMVECDVQNIPVLWRNLHRYDATQGYEVAQDDLFQTLGLQAPQATPVAEPVKPEPRLDIISPVVVEPPAKVAEPITREPRLDVRHIFAGLARNWLVIMPAVILLVTSLIGVHFLTGFPNFGPSPTAPATQTPNASATTAAYTLPATIAAIETAVVATASTVQFPYVVPAPARQCDTGVAPWQESNNTGDTIAVSCLSNPKRTHLVLTCRSGSSQCSGGVYLTTGSYFTLPSRYTISVDVSGVGSGGSANINLQSSSPYAYYDVALFANGGYNLCHTTSPGQACPVLGYGYVNAGTKTTLAIQVSGSGVSEIVNGTVIATIPDTHMATSSDVTLGLVVFEITGTSGAHADFANFRITQS